MDLDKSKKKLLYASYAREDLLEVVKRIQGIESQTGAEVFTDCLSMNSGEQQEEKIYEIIMKSDSFLLFWSLAASRSKWVKKEWTYALRERGLDFFKIIPLEDPSIAPPPKELASLHFMDKNLILLNMQRSLGHRLSKDTSANSFQAEIEPPFDAYEGKEPYLFVSYAHLDKRLVYPIIDDLNKQGVRIWYDEGIPAASDWIAEIADTIIKSACFLVFITPRALKSKHVRKEIDFADNKEKKMFVIYLEDTELPSQIEFQIGSIQALHRHKMTKERFWKKLRDQLSEVMDSFKSPKQKTNNDKETILDVKEDGNTSSKRLGSIKIKEDSSSLQNNIFISYSFKDKEWLDLVHVYLKPLKLYGEISYWDDTKIKPGENWREKISEAIKSSKVVILLISADYLASEFLINDELPSLLDAAMKHGTVIIPLIISPSRFNKIETLARFKPINNPENEVLINLNKGKQAEILVRLSDAVEEAFKHAERAFKSKPPSKEKIFISYSHKDKYPWLERLQVHFKPLEREGIIQIWDDMLIELGENWYNEIKGALASAKVGIFLVSADFLASHYFLDEKLPDLLNIAKSRGIILIPVIVNHCRFMKSLLAELQALNDPKIPLVTLTEGEQNAVFVKLANTVERLLSK